MTEVRRIGVLSLAKMVGMIYLALGLIFFLFFACFGLVAFLANSNGKGIAEAAIMLLFVCVMLVMYGIMGFIADAFIALVYNVLAFRVGGVELELVPQATPAPKNEEIAENGVLTKSLL